MGRRREQEEMRRLLVSQTVQEQGKIEVKNSLYSAKTMVASILHLYPAPLFASPQGQTEMTVT